MYLHLEILGFYLEIGKMEESEETETLVISDFPTPIVSSADLPSDPIGLRLYGYEEDEDA